MAEKYIITLSSIPPRFHQIGPVLESLLAQTAKPEKIILYLSRHYGRYPDWDGALPEVPDGVEIRLVDEDYGPATKVIPALKQFATGGYNILFLDDDQIYPRNLARYMLKIRKRRPNDCLAVSRMLDYDPLPGTTRQFQHTPRPVRRWRKTHLGYQLHLLWLETLGRITGKTYQEPPRRVYLRSGYADGFEGFRGVMVRPEFFPPEVFNIPDFARAVDDIWLSGHALRMGHPAWIMGGVFAPCLESKQLPAHEDETALHHNEFHGRDRKTSNHEVVRYFQETYGIWL
ncbi:hypothetical protein SAMN05444000_104216 [Shimia gijangensis]|uniref:Glycosyl transferase family 2 n=1 Tax=Shimia gijangensis TaxID=1470563 RepID=A0A1M6G035_9RHOB|nr:glycosyltransferase family A protein [Shimia gijangensis]SHJ03296.1 hypothetical protein SAMN05444000_104216 [Shimia gijangensis]